MSRSRFFLSLFALLAFFFSICAEAAWTFPTAVTTAFTEVETDFTDKIMLSGWPYIIAVTAMWMIFKWVKKVASAGS